MTALLLERGADPALTDKRTNNLGLPVSSNAHHDSRTAAEWASTNGHNEIATLIQQTRLVDRSRSSDKHIHGVVVDDPLILTGIKVLDLFSPVVKGGVIRFPFSARVGMMVLLGELCQRFLHSINGAAVWSGFTQPPFDPDDWTAEFSELGIRALITISLAHCMEDVQEQKDRFMLGIQAAERLRDEGHDVLAILFRGPGIRE